MFAKAAAATFLVLAAAPTLASDVTYDPQYPGAELRAVRTAPAPSQSEAKPPGPAPCNCCTR